MDKSFGRCVFSSAALISAASAVIFLPLTSSDGTDLAAVLVAAVFSAVFTLLGYIFIPKLLSCEKPGCPTVKKCLFAVSNLIAAALMILFAVLGLRELVEFAADEVLPEAPFWAVLILFAAVAFFIAKGSFLSIKKTAAIYFAAATFLTLVIFLFSVPKMSFKYIIPNGFPEVSATLKAGLRIFLKTAPPSVVSVSVVLGSKKQRRAAFWGSVVGSGLVLLFTLNTLLVFGGGFAARLSYPYVSAVSTANMGDIFSGMDGFLYVSVFLFCIYKIAFLLYGIKTAVLNISSLKK